MCLGVPGQVVEIDQSNSELLMGKVSFGGLSKEVCLAYLPDVQLGEYVLVHAGFAITKLDEEHAAELFRYLAEMEELAGNADAALAGAELASAEVADTARARPSPEPGPPASRSEVPEGEGA